MESPQRILKLPDWEGVLLSPAAGEFRITDDGVFPPQKPKLPLSSFVLAKYSSIHAQEGAMVGSDGVEPPESNDSKFTVCPASIYGITPHVSAIADILC